MAAEVPEEQNNRQSDIHSDLAYCEKQYGEISLFPVESGRMVEKIGEQFNYLVGNDRDHMHPMSGTGDHQPR